MGKVIYWNEAAIAAYLASITFSDVAQGGQNDGFAKLLCVKREAFAHEREVRMLYCDGDQKRGNKGAFLYPLDPNTVFELLEVDPRLTVHGANVIIEGLKTLGLSIPMTRSTLYDTPKYTIRLE